jgi:fatty acid desaturase
MLVSLNQSTPSRPQAMHEITYARRPADGWTRITRAADAYGLLKLLVLVIGAVLWRASPLYAVGIVFALPLLYGVIAFAVWSLHAALGGWHRREDVDWHDAQPRPHLGRPSWERKPNDAGRRLGR